MLAFRLLLLVAIGVADVLSSPIQVSLQAPATKPRKLHGRFLHITDMHPDLYYMPHTSQSKACHRKKPKKTKKESGYYGTPYSKCDSPLVLTNFTLDFLDKHWSSELDFVIWTGDNARHDNDHKLPRTLQEIYDLNRGVAAKMKQIFTNKGIPVVPSLGNNDVWLMIHSQGPNSITLEFSSIWKSFIPFPFLQVFHRGAYYSTEVIPDQVAAVSLNTMYFYDSNKAVGGCGYKDPEDPGNLQFDWLEVQLKIYRGRGMQVFVPGHVPPSPGNYFPECYVRYVELSLRFQDTILGHLFGHMNADHFSFLEAIDLQFVPEDDKKPVEMRKELYETLLQEYSALPTKLKDLDFADYAVVNVAPSVVPNPYLPGFRVFAYNISAGANGEMKTKKRKHGHRRGDHGDKESYCRREIYRDTWKCHLNESWHSDAESPSRSNKQWSPLGYAQYYIPELLKANQTHKPKFKLEYLTLPALRLHPPPSAGDKSEEFIYPIPLGHLPRSLRNRGVSGSKYTPYEMEDLTIGSWIVLGQQLGNSERKKVRKRYKKYMYMGGEEG
ncbi:endopolyphosphatase [Tricholoma matsutake]|nr:endopolyphosphatase [Tricholoma matsutake 945]